MIPNYPYFGLPNYMRYMNPKAYPYHVPNIQNNNILEPSIPNNRQNAYFVNSNNKSNTQIRNTNHIQYKIPNNNSNNCKINKPPATGKFYSNKYNPRNNNMSNNIPNLESSKYNSQKNYKAFDNNNLNTNDNKYISSSDKSATNYSPIFNILGIDIFFDDILILSILFFLYKEQVNDPYLFFTLILLLMN